MPATTSSWATNLFAVTIFAEDLTAMREFYDRAFGLPLEYEDENSAIYRFGETMINILHAAEASTLIEPAKVDGPNGSARSMFTINVQDVDAICEQLIRNGVKILNGPVDRPWGPRTAAFADPAGHVWEIASHG